MARTCPVELRKRAARAQLRYVNSGECGFTRRRCGRGFTYLGRNGRTLKSARTKARIQSLAIPPAWNDVWICCDANGHVQATGYDIKTRKQSIYHRRWHEISSTLKFDGLVGFARLLPHIRRQVELDLDRPQLDQHRVVAAVVRILDQGQLRVGNAKYAEISGTRGATTLTPENADVNDTLVSLDFKAKGGKRRQVTLKDAAVASVIRNCEEIGGQFLFSYTAPAGQSSCRNTSSAEEVVRDVTSETVNDYLRAHCDEAISAKDFRTWWGSVFALQALREDNYGIDRDPASIAARKRRVVQAVKFASNRLGNTPAVCRASYVHPGIIDAVTEGRFSRLPHRSLEKRMKSMSTAETHLAVLLPEL